MDSGPLEDPRTWGDFAFDDLPPTNLRDSAYASRGGATVDDGGTVRVSANVRAVPSSTPSEQPLVPPVKSIDVPAQAASPPAIPAPPVASQPQQRLENTESREAAEERKAMLVFYGLFIVVALVAAYVVYLLLSTPS
jgi:hypothetical protein